MRVRDPLFLLFLLDAVFGTLPYTLSHKAQLCGVFLAVILSEGLTRLRGEIAQETKDAVALTTERVHRWGMVHMRMKELVEKIGEMFQGIFLVSFVSGFSNVIGSSVFFISSDMVTSSWSYVHSLGIMCIFGGSATAMAYPLIQVLEKTWALTVSFMIQVNELLSR
ncbi:hypothetical protein BV898_19216 [Hypsibius exemplaris]|uniref:ABC transmembrane type-1 domain-containing protein n=1 Tax=Hypsibius exemplaris TaxID=2072580 RepID=A0A9X6NIM6_HYPEX|nr:hypothetical protein BV898_19216 [Hypsibius exemplaris]